MEGTGKKVVKGAIADSHNGAGEADDVVGHAKVWCRQVHQQWLSVESHKITGAVRDRKPSREGNKEVGESSEL